MSTVHDEEYCSLLLPTNSSLSAFSGFLTSSSGIGYYLHLTLPDCCQDGRTDEASLLHAARLDVDWRLEYILRGHMTAVVKLLGESESVIGFLRDLKNLVDQLEITDRSAASSRVPLPQAYYQLVIDDLAKVGWQHVIETSADLTALKLVASDEQGRSHELSLHLTPSQYPTRAPVIRAEVPLPFKPQWSSSSGLVGLFAQFKHWIGQFQSFWSTMEEIDLALWVLEPLKPTKGCDFRRIVIDSSVSVTMYLKVDCLRPLDAPQCSFLGPDNYVTKMKKVFDTGRHQWNPDMSVVENLKAIMRVEFPQKPSLSTEQVSMECSVCYQGNEGGDVPDIRCDNCAKHYHKTCIVEWFEGQPTTIYTFQSLSGECLYCCKRIAVKP